MNTGKVKWWNDAKGFGYIRIESRPELGDIFAHYSAIQGEGFKTLSEDQEVKFELVTGPKGSQAFNIEKLK